MTDRKTILAIVDHLRQGLSSSLIAEKLCVSPPTVWAVRANLTQGKYDDKPTLIAESKEHADGYDHAKKSAAIMAGYWNSVANHDKPGTPSDAAVEFSRLLALITSPRKAERDLAKSSIRDFAENGGWNYRSKITFSSSVDVESSTLEKSPQGKRPNKWRRWSEDEQALLLQVWADPNGKRDSLTLHELSDQLSRTPLAMIIRLFKFELISLDEGNALCLAAKTPILLSETNVVNSNDLEAKQLLEVDDVVEIAELAETESKNASTERICINCTKPIPAARLKLVPLALRCAKCQSFVEKTSDYHQYIDEGLAGTREAHKLMRGGLLSDMMKRGKE